MSATPIEGTVEAAAAVLDDNDAAARRRSAVAAAAINLIRIALDAVKDPGDDDVTRLLRRTGLVAGTPGLDADPAARDEVRHLVDQLIHEIEDEYLGGS